MNKAAKGKGQKGTTVVRMRTEGNETSTEHWPPGRPCFSLDPREGLIPRVVTLLPNISIVQLCRDFMRINDVVSRTSSLRPGVWYVVHRRDSDEYVGQPSHMTWAIKQSSICPQD